MVLIGKKNVAPGASAMKLHYHFCSYSAKECHFTKSEFQRVRMYNISAGGGRAFNMGNKLSLALNIRFEFQEKYHWNSS